MSVLQASFVKAALSASGLTTFRTAIIALLLLLRRTNAKNPRRPAIHPLTARGIYGIKRVKVFIKNAFRISSMLLYPNIVITKRLYFNYSMFNRIENKENLPICQERFFEKFKISDFTDYNPDYRVAV